MRTRTSSTLVPQLAGQNVQGLGTDTPATAAVETGRGFVRLHEAFYRRLGGAAHAGIGLRLDSRTDVTSSDDDPGTGSQSKN